MSPTTFDVTYRVGFADMNAFFGAWQKRTWFDRTNRRRFLLFTGVILALTAFSARPFLKQILIWPFQQFWLNALYGAVFLLVSVLWCGCVAFVLTFFLSPLLTYCTQLLTFAFGPMRKRTSRVRTSVAGIDKTTGEVESRTKWHDIVAVVDTKKTVLLFTNRNCAAIIPKSAFASPEDAQAFATFAKAQWDDAQSVF